MGAKLGGDAKLQELLSKSVFLISIGSQDLNPRWNPQPDDQPQGSVIRELAELYVDAVRSLYDMGARKLAIVNTGHIGCMPKRRNYVCDQSLNEITAEFSQALPSFIPSVSSEKAGFSDSIGDFYGFETDIFADPTAFDLSLCKITSSPWPDLPPDLLGLILCQLLCHTDRVSFAAVCHGWRLAARQLGTSLPTAKPCMTFGRGAYQSLADDGVKVRHIAAPTGYCAGATFGSWVLYEHKLSRRCFLHNPLSPSTPAIEVPRRSR
nr:GDSL esterase/lipase At4g18970-like [Aegilops tauschii subsp. strangulata]